VKVENANPGVEVIDKITGKQYTIQSLSEEGGLYLSNGVYAFDCRRLRLANKPKRAELVARIKELEKDRKELLEFQERNVPVTLQQPWEYARDLNDTLHSYKSMAENYKKEAESILSGTYFTPCPHRQKWQHIAQVTGQVISGTSDGTVVIWPKGVTVSIDTIKGLWLPDEEDIYGMVLYGEWTDEPFEARIVRPVGGQKDEPK